MSLVRNSDLEHLLHAGRLALRGRGRVEPNPMVGCVIIRPDGNLAGWGYHRACGEAHAEIIALKRAGDLAAGATAYVTLEPCNHTGRTGPCTEALIAAKIARVVIGRRDPHPQAGGGVTRLRAAGIEVDVTDEHLAVASITDPFVHRIETGLPWVIAKWAQTLDGRIATRDGESQWISNEASRRLVHRERGKVDAILTGIGTVLADDPMLTARNVRKRRIARRVVIDPKLQIPLDSKLVQSAAEVPLIVACHETMISGGNEKIASLEAAGVEFLGIPLNEIAMSLAPVLRELVIRHDATSVLVEAGAGLMGKLFAQQLINEVWVFIAPKLLGDEQAMPSIRGLDIATLSAAKRLKLIRQHRRGDDVVLRYYLTKDVND